jgi:arylsulfatase A-like enzyme
MRAGWLAVALTACSGKPESPVVQVVAPPGGLRRFAAPTCAVTLPDGWALVGVGWEIDGVAVGGGADGPPPDAWRRGDHVVCAATAHRPRGDAVVVRSTPVEVLNTAPDAPRVRFVTPRLLAREPARCAAVVRDVDGDAVTLRWRWWVDGVEVGERSSVLPGGHAPGAALRCEATPDDGDLAGPTGEAAVRTAALGGNVLLVVLDDVGVDQIGEFAGAATTPRLDALAASGVRFSRAYAEPVCSPTRAALLTGRMPHQHGVGSQLRYPDGEWSLPPSERTLAEALGAAGYATAAVGKWHLDTAAAGGPMAPLTVGGFDHFEGFDDNLMGVGFDGAPVDYFSWVLNRDGAYARVDDYNTSALVDLALAQGNTLPEPWFVYLGLAAAHSPSHIPPAGLYHVTPGDTWRGRERYDAMVEAADTELGRLLDGLDPGRAARTTVVVVSDNGTDPTWLQAPFPPGRGKGTVYEGGVRVPLIVVGPAVAAPGREVDHLVHARDLFATVLDVAGLGASAPPESVSLAPYLIDPGRAAQRAWLTSERFEPPGLGGVYVFRDQMVRDERYKLIRRQEGRRELYDLAADPWELDELLARDPSLRGEADRLEGLLDAALAAP